MKTTYIHVPALLGCMLNGPTTDAAIEATPGVIRAFLQLMARAGERTDADAVFRTKVAEHAMEPGVFLGSRFLPSDAAPLPPRETQRLMHRLDTLHQDLRRLAGPIPPKRAAATPAKGRSLIRILAHVCGEGNYLRGIPGASRIPKDVEEGKLDPFDALDRLHALELERLRTMGAAERGGVIVRGQSPWSARSAVRRMLEHGWEHYMEIAARLGAEP
jgi:hypothetical protein